jgi:hypothetical protein
MGWLGLRGDEASGALESLTSGCTLGVMAGSQLCVSPVVEMGSTTMISLIMEVVMTSMMGLS